MVDEPCVQRKPGRTGLMSSLVTDYLFFSSRQISSAIKLIISL